MSCVVYLKNKKSGYVYAYESVSYRDPVTRMPKSKRTFIGRVDPITKKLLDPEKAEKLRKKRAAESESSPVIQKLMPLEPKQDDSSDQDTFKELQLIKEQLILQHNELVKVQETQKHDRETILNVVSMIQQALLTS